MDRESSTISSSGNQVATNVMAEDDFCSRRTHQRVFCADQDISLSIRLRGELRSHRAELLDISSYGAALALTRPLTAERTAFLTIEWGEYRIKDMVCTISNCLQTSKTNALLTGYRCGVSFRPASPLQLDRSETIEQVNALTDALVQASETRQPGRAGPVKANPAATSPSDSEPLPPAQPAA